MSYLGIDLGTSEVKATLVDEEQRVIANAGVSLSISNPQEHWSEQSPEEWWHATKEAVDKVRAAAPHAFSALRGIALSGQMHGATLLDARQRVLRPAILWNDTRAYAECVELEALVVGSRNITGNLAMPGFTAPKILWLQKYEPAIFERLHTVLLPKDYLVFRLTGDFVSDMSDASGTLWLDVAKRDWSDRMLAATGLTRAHMPRLVEGSSVGAQLRDELRREWGLDHAVMVAGGAGDNAAAAVGIGAIAQGGALLSLGTSGVLGVATDRFAPNPEQAAHAFCHCLPQRWHQMSVILSAASSLSWLAALTQTARVDELARLAETADPAAAPIFLPYLSGERTPHNDAQARGMFFGMSAKTDRAALAYSVMEGVSFAMADGNSALATTGTKVEYASFVGGGSRSRFWGELLATVTDITLLKHADSAIGGAFGAARLARLATSGEAPEAVCTMPAVQEEIRSNPERKALLTDRYEKYRKLYQVLRHSMGSLNPAL